MNELARQIIEHEFAHKATFADFSERIIARLTAGLTPPFAIKDIDDRFLNGLEALELPEREANEIFGLWLQFTEHNEREKRMHPLSKLDQVKLIEIFERMLSN